jgi:hypothetical protein
VIACVPNVVKVAVSVAVNVGGTPVFGLKPTLVTEGVPGRAVPLAEKTTVPVGPAPLLAMLTTVAVSVRGVPDATVGTLGTTDAVVVAFETVTTSVTGPLGL